MTVDLSVEFVCVKEPPRYDPFGIGMNATGIPLIKELQGNGGKQLW